MKKKNVLPFLQFLLIVLAGCTPIAENNFDSTRSPIPRITQTKTLIASPSPRPTFLKPSATPTPFTKEISQNYEEIPICASEGEPIPLPATISLPGTIVFQRGYYQGLYTYDGKTKTTMPMDTNPNQQYFVFGYSPNGEWLAYSPDFNTGDVDKPPSIAKIKLISKNGQPVETSLDLSIFNNEMESGFQLVGFSMDSHWINDQIIYATLYAAQPQKAGPIIIYPTIFNPFSGAWESSLLDSLPKRFSSYKFDFSADIHYAISESSNGFLLTDLVNDTILWREEDSFIPNSMIRWLPKGNSGVVAKIKDPVHETKIYLLSKEGEETRLTLSGGQNIGLEFLSVSDDGRYVSVTAYTPEEELLLYDVVQGKFIARCPFVGHLGTPIPVWSPDSYYIAYIDPKSPAQILDVETGFVYEIANDFTIVDWK